MLAKVIKDWLTVHQLLTNETGNGDHGQSRGCVVCVIIKKQATYLKQF